MKIKYRKGSVFGASGALSIVVTSGISLFVQPNFYPPFWIGLGCLAIACAIMFSVKFNTTKTKKDYNTDWAFDERTGEKICG